mmetsp:Transcript_21389/g.49772  ORF Transcript_21389/g.49772 Transcript_21389/m.49772 type:complete len:272 (-) Transcript_21389:144-959(-)|eukprot:CAMPEP_0178448512 /NCGR_PEP_ID=MMETSP0689_2-20121128/42030_1 /TAXON_ID=160604 /ORGANISM="Amphidinium massartii, Strain CS-259" /LENGTH=271 /DNA_ID=CAMNT_0020073715 /DNA_START=89 /DNA_END=904 /DNA_ORIENTATION=+
MSEGYDKENIFAKIIEGKTPCFKVYESKASLAFLDAFPSVPGHTLLVSKAKGYKDFIEMPEGESKAYMNDLHLVAAAVKKATGAVAVNIVSNCGKEAGQSVFHPHFHIIPRSADDGLKFEFSPAKEMITAEEAGPMQKKIEEIIKPPQPLKKPKYGKVSSIKPESKGLNLKLKVVEAAKEVELKGKPFWEVLCGDASGTIVISLVEGQKELLAEGTTIEVRNGMVKMIKGHIRLVVDKWGKILKAEEPFEGEVEMAEKKNVSAMEYELVTT